MYCLYVGFDYTYIHINALAQGITSFLASQVWLQAVAGARTYGTDSQTITSQPRSNHSATETSIYMYVCKYVRVRMYVLMYDYIYVLFVCRG